MKSKKGFASMSLEKRREIAAMGGRRAHELGKGHQFTIEEARLAGKKGGEATKTRRMQLASSKEATL